MWGWPARRHKLLLPSMHSCAAGRAPTSGSLSLFSFPSSFVPCSRGMGGAGGALQVDLSAVEVPHITLYLTAFQSRHLGDVTAAYVPLLFFSLSSSPTLHTHVFLCVCVCVIPFCSQRAKCSGGAVLRLRDIPVAGGGCQWWASFPLRLSLFLVYVRVSCCARTRCRVAWAGREMKKNEKGREREQCEHWCVFFCLG